MQEDQDGPLMQRQSEHRGTSDRAIVAGRRLVLRAAKNLAKGTDPGQPGQAAYRVHSLAGSAPAEVPWTDLFESVQPSPADTARAADRALTGEAR